MPFIWITSESKASIPAFSSTATLYMAFATVFPYTGLYFLKVPLNINGIHFEITSAAFSPNLNSALSPISKDGLKILRPP